MRKRTTSQKRTTKNLTKTATCPKRMKRKTTKTKKTTSMGVPPARHPVVCTSPSKRKLEFLRLPKNESHRVHFAGGVCPPSWTCAHTAGRSGCPGGFHSSSWTNGAEFAGREQHQG